MGFGSDTLSDLTVIGDKLMSVCVFTLFKHTHTQAPCSACNHTFCILSVASLGVSLVARLTYSLN